MIHLVIFEIQSNYCLSLQKGRSHLAFTPNSGSREGSHTDPTPPPSRQVPITNFPQQITSVRNRCGRRSQGFQFLLCFDKRRWSTVIDVFEDRCCRLLFLRTFRGVFLCKDPERDILYDLFFYCLFLLQSIFRLPFDYIRLNKGVTRLPLALNFYIKSVYFPGFIILYVS